MDCRDNIQLAKWCNILFCMKPLQSYNFMIKAAILAATLDLSVSSRIHSCYPPDMHYIGPNDIESIDKKTLTFHAGYSYLAAWLLHVDIYTNIKTTIKICFDKKDEHGTEGCPTYWGENHHTKFPGLGFFGQKWHTKTPNKRLCNFVQVGLFLVLNAMN